MITLYVSKITDARETIQTLEASGHQWQQVALSMSTEGDRAEYRELKSKYDWPTLPLIVDESGLVGGHQELITRLSPAAPSQRAAQVLGLGGLIPFVALAVWVVLDRPLGSINVKYSLLAYAATILSFVGAIQWGMAIGGADATKRRFSSSVLPSLVAWLILSIPLIYSQKALLFAAAFAAWYAFERLTFWADYPRWFQLLRRLLTGVVCATLTVVGLLAN